VFVTRRSNSTGPQGWGEAKEAGLPVGYHHATLSPDGKTMYLQGPLEKDRWGLFVSKSRRQDVEQARRGWRTERQRGQDRRPARRTCRGTASFLLLRVGSARRQGRDGSFTPSTRRSWRRRSESP